MIRVENATKRYARGQQEVAALDGVSLEIGPGRFIAVMGPSGSGKSTLLNLLGALDRPTSGEIRIDGRALSSMSDDERTLLRRERIGFVFQFFNLLPTLSALENVCLPALLARRPRAEMETKAKALLDRVGLSDRVHHRPNELSGGQMQRVAVARALCLDPALVLADEPTGNLDSAAGEQILGLLRAAAKEYGRTVVMVTHDPKAAHFADEIVELEDGRIVRTRVA